MAIIAGGLEYEAARLYLRLKVNHDAQSVAFGLARAYGADQRVVGFGFGERTGELGALHVNHQPMRLGECEQAVFERTAQVEYQTRVIGRAPHAQVLHRDRVGRSCASCARGTGASLRGGQQRRRQHTNHSSTDIRNRRAMSFLGEYVPSLLRCVRYRSAQS